MTKKQLKQFLADRPAIKKTGFAKECKISFTWLQKILSGEKPMTPKVEISILEGAKKYGFNNKK